MVLFHVHEQELYCLQLLEGQKVYQFVVLTIMLQTLIGATGVPLFSKLPMIGWMFHTNLKKDDKEELLIFITPKIIEMEEPASVKKTY